MSRLIPATRNRRFYLTGPQPCPYLPGRVERKAFTSLQGREPGALHDVLVEAGFRRSQAIAYRPACEGCDLCLPVRVPVERFQLTRNRRRVHARNADITRIRRPPMATQAQFDLLRGYLKARHPDGGMAEMGVLDYAAMVEETTVHTHVCEYRRSGGPNDGELIGAALVDLTSDGLSLVYAFWDDTEAARSFGTWIILDHIEQARTGGLPFVYLGYWVPGSERMAYKARFQPLEVLRGSRWMAFEEAIGTIDAVTYPNPAANHGFALAQGPAAEDGGS